jgi:hypothetical protein
MATRAILPWQVLCVMALAAALCFVFGLSFVSRAAAAPAVHEIGQARLGADPACRPGTAHLALVIAFGGDDPAAASRSTTAVS